MVVDPREMFEAVHKIIAQEVGKGLEPAKVARATIGVAIQVWVAELHLAGGTEPEIKAFITEDIGKLITETYKMLEGGN